LTLPLFKRFKRQHGEKFGTQRGVTSIYAHAYRTTDVT